MYSPTDENRSSSGTSDSEKQNFRLKLSSFVYPLMPKRNSNLRLQQQNNLKISTNLFELKLIDEVHKFTLFSIEILPEIANDNYPLRRQIYNVIETYLPKSFKKSFFAGNNLYSFILDENAKNYKEKEINEEINKTKYCIKLKQIQEIELRKVNDFNGTNLKIKSIIENIIRNILMSNPNMIKFHDRTLFEIDKKNIENIDNQYNQKIYKGYTTAAHITENGLFMLINNRNKLISGKTALQKMTEIRRKLEERNASYKEIKEEINYYFHSHRTVLTTYGSLKAYKIKEVNFDRTPNNTNINFKDIKGENRNISIINYYKNQYNIDINQKNQPLLVAESNNQNSKNKKLLISEKKNLQSEDDYVIYLLPELVYITGIEDDDTYNNRRNNSKNIINKTRATPSTKMSAINGILDLTNSNKHKIIKKKNGQTIELKSPKELIKEFGINLGDNLTFPGRIIRQPEIFFKNDYKVEPKNGLFRADKPWEVNVISNDNIFFIYDKNERNSNHRKLFNDLMNKFRNKDFHFSNDFHPNKVFGYGIENTNNWENIEKFLRKINLSNKKCFGIIFCSHQLEKFYEKLKNFFFQYEIPTQHIITRKIEDQRRGNSIQFNIIDQINIKMGGINYYINFKNEGIIKSGEVFLIIGLDSKTANKKITYSMTSTRNSRLNDFITQEKTVDDVKQEKNNTLTKMFETAIDEINKNCPHSPDYIIIYRQGGNDIHNKILTINELDNFTGILKEYREKYKEKNNFNFRNTKLYYICCNLKSDLKFFETDNRNTIKAYFNPKSGLIVDDNVTQKNKYEFYLQPQYVNQGTATPCHYQIMYYDKGSNEENELKIENLEKLSFYLSFYYWTWSGAIRIPSLLKMSSTAMTFYSKVLDNEKYYFFRKPTYI